MIKDIVAGPGINISGNYGNPYVGNSGQSAGMLRYNTVSQQTEVYDGNNWLSVTSTPQIGLNPNIMTVIEWAEKKMLEERQLKELMSKHPGLKDTYEKFEIMKALCKENNVTG